MLNQITPVILTFNEEANIRRTLSALEWASDVLVVDSLSTDSTLDICAEFNNVRVVNHAFDSFAKQCNFALSQDIKTDWVLSMDADYVVTQALIDELTDLKPRPEIYGYKISFQYLIGGKPLRGSLYPARTSLYRKSSALYVQDGHAHHVEINGKVSALKAKIQHDDRKANKRWLNSQWRYAQQEANKLKQTHWRDLSLADKVRKTGLAPLVVLPYTLFAKGLILNAWPGLVYSSQRFIAELYLQIARVMK